MDISMDISMDIHIHGKPGNTCKTSTLSWSQKVFFAFQKESLNTNGLDSAWNHECSRYSTINHIEKGLDINRQQKIKFSSISQLIRLVIWQWLLVYEAMKHKSVSEIT